jgi:7-carboxy-7-deazaguanine synthase
LINPESFIFEAQKFPNQACCHNTINRNEQVSELKVVVSNQSDLIFAEQNAATILPNVARYLQAEWGNASSKDLVMQYVLAHRDWRVSVQTHKLSEVR